MPKITQRQIIWTTIIILSRSGWVEILVVTLEICVYRIRVCLFLQSKEFISVLASFHIDASPIHGFSDPHLAGPRSNGLPF